MQGKMSVLNNPIMLGSPPQAILHSEGHMDDGLSLSRSQREESHTARLIRCTLLLFSRFIRYDPFTALWEI